MTGAASIVVLTGAGISRESNLATFRDADGIWATVRIEDVATPEAFERDPARVQAFYNARRAQLADPSVTDNAAHRALARLEREWPGDVLLVTQNIDDLHERAGSRHVLHMHGELFRARCLACASVHEWRGDIDATSACPRCAAHALRPHVVWFGEIPLFMDVIEAALDECGLFVSIGTSGSVYPAAGFVRRVGRRARTVELNLEPSGGAQYFDEAYHGTATVVVPVFVDRLVGQSGRPTIRDR